MHGNYEVSIFLVPMFVCIGNDPLSIYLLPSCFMLNMARADFFLGGVRQLVVLYSIMEVLTLRIFIVMFEKR